MVHALCRSSLVLRLGSRPEGLSLRSLALGELADGPYESSELARNRNDCLLRVLASSAHPLVLGVKPFLSFPRDHSDFWIQALIACRKRPRELGHEAIAPSRFNTDRSGVDVSGLGDRTAPASLPARVLRRHQPQIPHELRSRVESQEVTNLHSEGRGSQNSHASKSLEISNQGAQRRCWDQLFDLQRQPSNRCARLFHRGQVLAQDSLLSLVLEL